MLTIACVLKKGGDFEPMHVTRLRDSVERYLSLKHRFVCLTDDMVDGEVIPLGNRWPSWWSKINLFRHGQFDGPVVYFDLDVLIVGQLDPIVLGHSFTMLRSFWPHGKVNSSVMAWTANNMAAVYERFSHGPVVWMNGYRSKSKWGDQDFIFDHTQLEPEYWQDKHPGAFRSYKLDVEKNGGHVPEGTRAVIFHGQPRPWNTEIGRQHAPG
jgi:hypothetical protein